MSPESIQALPFTYAFGAVVTGVDFTRARTEDEERRLQSLFAERSLLVFRDVDVGLDTQMRLLSLFQPVGPTRARRRSSASTAVSSCS
jgi:alpha-ketoglutarate-dependent taurine dioxygenase